MRSSGRACASVIAIMALVVTDGEAAAQVDGPHISVILGNGGMFATCGVLVLGRSAS